MIKRTLNLIGGMRTRTVNKKINKINKSNAKKGVNLVYLQAEQKKVTSVRQALKRGFVLNPNKAEYCAAYATRLAEKKFGLKFVRAHAWELANKNKLLVESRFNPSTLRGEISKTKLKKLIKEKKLKPGMILGVFYPESDYNQTKRRVTHAMTFVGKETFWHNYYGPKSITIKELYSASEKGKRIFFPVQVIGPK